MVDPDNRRPVDYELRRQLIASLEGATVEQILDRADEGLPKLWLMRTALHLRREHPEWFGAEASYSPLTVTGDRGFAFLRADRVAVVVPRFRDRADSTVTLPEGSWRNPLTSDVPPGGEVPLADLLRPFPVALLVRE